MSCPLCRARKPRRGCPAVGQEICAVCCGTKRLTEIACPADCVFLLSAQRHPAAAVKRQQERDLNWLMATLGPLSERQLELFFLLQTIIIRHKPAAMASLVDADVAEATGSLAATFETASRGVLYEHQATSPAAEALRRELKDVLTEVIGSDSRLEREAIDVLRGIERAAKHDTPGLGAGAVEYLTLAARVLQERPPSRAGGSPIILP
jgi:hypothetical protein